MNNKFSGRRVAMLLHRHLVQNRQSLIMAAAVIFAVFLITDISIFKNTTDSHESMPLASLCSTMIAAVTLTVLGSLTFATQATKRQRIQGMLLPASKCEKFTSLFTIYIVGGSLFTALAAISAIGLCCLFFPGTGFADITLLFPGFNSEVTMFTLIVLGGLLGGQALYLLGSVFWPRKSFIKTFVVLSLLQLLMPILVTFSAMTDLLQYIDLNETRMWISIAICYACIGLIYFLAWRKYRSWQLVQKFMMN